MWYVRAPAAPQDPPIRMRVPFMGRQNLQFRRRGAINIVTRVAAMSSVRTIRTLDFNFNLKSLRPTAGTTYDQ